jgi:hypothetical protein
MILAKGLESDRAEVCNVGHDTLVNLLIAPSNLAVTTRIAYLVKASHAL